MTACLPYWWDEVLAVPNQALDSGCPPDASGSVPCAPADLLAAANRRLGRPVSLDCYSLGRMLVSEYGSGSPTELSGMAWAARNHAARRGESVTAMLLRGGLYGDQRQGRWADTRQDPTLRALAVAQGVLAGHLGDLGLRAALDFVDPSSFAPLGEGDPRAYISNLAISGDGRSDTPAPSQSRRIWIGPVPGVDPRQLFLTRAPRGGDDLVTITSAGLDAALGGAATAEAAMKNDPGACRGGRGTFPKSTLALFLGGAAGAAAALL